jgi:hypothetical protein
MSDQVKKSLLNSIFMLFCAAISLTFITACSDGEKAKMRPNKSKGGQNSPKPPPDPNDPESGNNTYAPETVGAITLSAFDQLYRANDIIMNGEKAENILTQNNCQRIIKPQKIAGNQTFSLVNAKASCAKVKSDYNWEGEEVFEVETDSEGVISGSLKIQGQPVILADRQRRTKITKHIVNINREEKNVYSYTQELNFEIEPMKTSDETFFVTIQGAGLFNLNAKKQISKIIPTSIELQQLIGAQNGRNFVNTTMSFADMSRAKEISLICGRAVADLSAEQTLARFGKKEDSKIFDISATANAVSVGKRTFRLEKCGKGFAAFHTDLTKIGNQLQKDLGR